MLGPNDLTVHHGDHGRGIGIPPDEMWTILHRLRTDAQQLDLSDVPNSLPHVVLDSHQLSGDRRLRAERRGRTSDRNVRRPPRPRRSSHRSAIRRCSSHAKDSRTPTASSPAKALRRPGADRHRHHRRRREAMTTTRRGMGAPTRRGRKSGTKRESRPSSDSMIAPVIDRPRRST